MPVLLTLAFLLLLWAFIAWDRRRPVAPISRQALAKGWSPRSVRKWPLVAGLSLCCFVLGVNEWLVPSSPPFTGKLSFLFQIAYLHLGPFGPAYMWWGIAAVLAGYALVLWRNQETKHRDINIAA